MGTQASKLPRRSRSASRVVGGVLGAVAREVVGDRRDGVLCAPSDTRSKLQDTDCAEDAQGSVVQRGAQRPAGVVGLAGNVDGDVAASGDIDEGFDVIQISREDRHCGLMSQMIGSGDKVAVDHGDARVVSSGTQQAAVFGDLKREVNVNRLLGFGDGLDQAIDQDVLTRVAGAELTDDGHRDQQRAVVLGLEQHQVVAEQIFVSGEHRYGATIQHEISPVSKSSLGPGCRFGFEPG